MATITRTLSPITAKELIALQEFVTIPTFLIRELPQDKLYALMDLLSMVDESGEVRICTRELMKRWDWSNTKVAKFIRLLEEKDIGKTEKRQKKDTVFLVNTGFYGNTKDKKKTEKRQETIAGQSEKSLPASIETHKRIIDYFNRKCGRRYGYNNPSTIKYIDERLEQGYTEEEFYTVIDKKSSEWLGDAEMDKYLTPKTLFHNHFEDYLDQKSVERKSREQQELEDFYNRVDEWAKKKEMEAKRYDI